MGYADSKWRFRGGTLTLLTGIASAVFAQQALTGSEKEISLTR